MSRIAQKEDLSDPEVIADFAQAVGSERRLTALYLLTVADIRGTSPKVWNAWKGKLLEDLYRLTLRALGGARPEPRRRDRGDASSRRACCSTCASLPGTSRRRCGSTLELSYFARHDAGEIAWHTRSLSTTSIRRSRSCGRAVARSAKACRCSSTRPTGTTCSRASAATSTAPASTSSTPRSTPRATGYALDTFLVISPHLEPHYRDLIFCMSTTWLSLVLARHGEMIDEVDRYIVL